MKYILLLILFIVLISSAFAFITLKYIPAPHPTGKYSAYWDINFIIIYDYDSKTDYQIRQELIHEYVHQLCWDLFGIYPKNIDYHDERCFTGKGDLLID